MALQNGDRVIYAGSGDPPGFEARGKVLEIRPDGTIIVQWDDSFSGPIAYEEDDAIMFLSRI